MKYLNGNQVKPGDLVDIATIGRGKVVCDYDKKLALSGYLDWLDVTPALGDSLYQGVMIKTEAFGFIHYSENNGDIILIERNADK
jgi:hypothetical protein